MQFDLDWIVPQFDPSWIVPKHRLNAAITHIAKTELHQALKFQIESKLDHLYHHGTHEVLIQSSFHCHSNSSSSIDLYGVLMVDT